MGLFQAGQPLLAIAALAVGLTLALVVAFLAPRGVVRWFEGLR